MRNLLKYGLCLALILFTLGTTETEARIIKGVDIPDVLTVEDVALPLLGAGVRKKFFISVYVAALYVDTTARDAARIIGATEAKALTLHFLRDIDEEKLRQSFREGFFNNAQERLPQLQDRLDRLLGFLAGGVEKGSSVYAEYQPGIGTRIQRGDAQLLLTGDDFMEALLSIWLGPVPVDHELKDALLGSP